jgi:small multidrug resistance family-3 protein
MHYLTTILLFIAAACAEILGCYLTYLVLRSGRSLLYLVPALVSLAAFAWLLTLHPTGASRTYAAYGGVYVTIAMVWLLFVEKQQPTAFDLMGASVALLGMAIIAFQP